MMTEKQTTQMGKCLSWLLRHGAVSSGLEIRPDGFIAVDDVIEYFQKKSNKRHFCILEAWNVENIKHIVETDGKGRFRLEMESEGKLLLRAEQGHSIKRILDDDKMLQRITVENVANYPVAVHGTTKQKWENIQAEGKLRAGQRRHIHFAQGLPDDSNVQSGARSTSSVFLFINLTKAIESGYIFYISGNGVILCAGLSHKGNVGIAV